MVKSQEQYAREQARKAQEIEKQGSCHIIQKTGQPTNWDVTIKFVGMPHDADSITMRKFLLTMLETYDFDVAYEITKVEQVKK